MNILSAQNLSLEKGGKKLFNDLSFGLESSVKVGLIGRNGCGKSSLLNLLSGREAPDSGLLSLRNGTRVHYAEQNPDFDPEHTVADHLFQRDHPVGGLLLRYEEACHRVESEPGPESRRLLDDAMADMHANDAWKYEGEIRAVLAGLGIPDIFRKMGELSGGMAKKVALAQAVLSDADLLILDEPTNHLDGETILWLEDWLARRPGALLLVTHDRYFLERVCDAIWEIDGGALRAYPGHWTVYLEKKAERYEAEARKAEKTARLLVKEREWMSRAPCARGTKPKARIERIQDMERQEGLENQSRAQMSLGGRRLGKKVIEVHGISKSLGGRTLFERFTYSFKRGERIGLVGPNGSGKSTLIRVLTGSEEPDTGRVERGETVVVGLFDQHPPDLDANKTILESLREVGDVFQLDDGSKVFASDLLERFLFPPHQHYQKVERLSGGERRRLQLLKVLISNPNLLILDEPTNDLDVETLAALEDTLDDFGGTLLIISHDRYFLDKTVDFLVALDGRGGVRGYPGLYSDYLLWRKGLNEEERAAASAGRAASAQNGSGSQGALGAGDSTRSAGGSETASTATAVAPRRKRSNKEERELAEVLTAIDALEAEKGELEAFFSSGGGGDAKALADKYKRHREVETELEARLRRWEELEG